VFDSAYVVAAFEGTTGVRLKPRDLREYDRWRDTHPVARTLPRAELYDSPRHANDRFGGHFTVRIYVDNDDPDEGIRTEGLQRYLPERGPQEYQVSARAIRANVDVMFWSDNGEITPEAEAAWRLLTSCLDHL
jgi:hypothetical protein